MCLISKSKPLMNEMPQNGGRSVVWSWAFMGNYIFPRMIKTRVMRFNVIDELWSKHSSTSSWFSLRRKLRGGMWFANVFTRWITYTWTQWFVYCTGLCLLSRTLIFSAVSILHSLKLVLLLLTSSVSVQVRSLASVLDMVCGYQVGQVCFLLVSPPQ